MNLDKPIDFGDLAIERLRQEALMGSVVGEFIREKRRALYLTTAETAQRLGIEEHLLISLESGLTPFPKDMFYDFIRVLKLSESFREILKSDPRIAKVF